MDDVRKLLIDAKAKPKRRRRTPTPAQEDNENAADTQQQLNEDEVNGLQNSQSVENQRVQFEIGCSRNGAEVLWYGGFRFLFNKKAGDRVYWRCELSRKNGCAVKAVTDLNDYTVGQILPSIEANQHTHLPKPSGVQVEQRLANLNKRARTEPNVLTDDLVTEALTITEDDNEQFALMPTAEALTQRAAKRRRPFGLALNGNEVANIMIPPALCRKDNKAFLIYDSASVRPGADDRTILFASDKALCFLRHNRNWSADATFSVCPRVFKQKLVIGAYIQHRMFPAAYALMTRKTRQHYIEVLRELKNALGGDFCPESVLTDFEAAEIAAVKQVFPTARTQACLFHYGQSLFRRLKDEGLAKNFNRDSSIRSAFRRCISLAFLPPDIVRRGMAIIIEQSPPMEGFLFYVAKNYIGLSEWERTDKTAAFQSNSDAHRMFNDMAGHSTPRTSMEMPNPNDVRSLILTSFSRHSDEFSVVHPQPAGETSLNINHIGLRYTLPLAHEPLFQISFWNVRDRVKDEQPRSQASMEATHLAFQKQCKRRPRMFDFLTALHKWDTKKMQEVREALTKKLPRRRPEFIDMDRKLLHFVNTALLSTDQQILVFLDAISMALQCFEPSFQALGAEEETPEEIVEETAKENMPLFDEQNEIFIGHDHSYF